MEQPPAASPAAGSYALSELAWTIGVVASAGTTLSVATDLFRDDLVLL